MCYAFLLFEKVKKKRTPIIRKNRILIDLTDSGLRLSITGSEGLEEVDWWNEHGRIRACGDCLGDFNSINLLILFHRYQGS